MGKKPHPQVVQSLGGERDYLINALTYVLEGKMVYRNKHICIQIEQGMEVIQDAVKKYDGQGWSHVEDET